MKSFFYTIKIALWAMIALPMVMACSKNEQPFQEPAFTGLRVKIISAENFILRMSVGGEVISSQLTAPNPEGTPIAVQYYNPTQKVQLFDFYRNTIVTDTLFTYKPGYTNLISFYQPAAGEPLRLVGPPVNEPPAAEGATKLSVCYTYAPLADSLRVIVENAAPDNNVYKPTDSFTLKKGLFSPFFEGRRDNYKPVVKLYTTGADRKLVAQMPASQFHDMNADFTGYIFQDRLNAGPVADLAANKLY